jgi:hypothetical protein
MGYLNEQSKKLIDIEEVFSGEGRTQTEFEWAIA